MEPERCLKVTDKGGANLKTESFHLDHIDGGENVGCEEPVPRRMLLLHSLNKRQNYI